MSCFLHLPRPHQRMPASGAPSGECGGGAVETRMAIRILPPPPAYQAAAMRLGDDWIAGSGLIAKLIPLQTRIYTSAPRRARLFFQMRLPPAPPSSPGFAASCDASAAMSEGVRPACSICSPRPRRTSILSHGGRRRANRYEDPSTPSARPHPRPSAYRSPAARNVPGPRLWYMSRRCSHHGSDLEHTSRRYGHRIRSSSRRSRRRRCR